MTPLWSLSTKPHFYSRDAVKLFNELIHDCRESFAHEFKHEIDKGYAGEFHLGMRFNSNEFVLHALQSNVDEISFFREPKYVIAQVLMGASQSDYDYFWTKEY